jgi:predicted MFS family arabinose efflux permease
LTGRVEDTARYHIAAQALLPQAFFLTFIWPSYLGALVDHKGFTNKQIADVASADSIGGLAALLLLTAVLTRIDRRHALLAGVGVLSLANLFNLGVDSYGATLALRTVAGFATVWIFGLAVAYFGNTALPERWFAWRATIAVVLQGVLFLAAPRLIAAFGVESLYLGGLLLTPLSLWAIANLPARPLPYRAPPAPPVPGTLTRRRVAVWWLVVGVGMFSFYYQPLFVFSERLGHDIGLDANALGLALAVTTVIGVIGSLAVSWQGERFGRTLPIFASGIIGIGIAFMLTRVNAVLPYWIALSLFSIIWSYMPCYLMGFVAVADPDGRLAVGAQAVAMVATILSTAITGLLLDRYGLGAPGIVAMVGMAACVAITMVGAGLYARERRAAMMTESL